MGVAGFISGIGYLRQPIFSLIDDVNSPISVDRDRWIARAEDCILLVPIAMRRRVRN